MEHFDVIIVGGGSAGCALAGRLSEDPQRRVLVLEAGPNFRQTADFPSEILDHHSKAAAKPGHPFNWSFTGALTDKLSYRLPRGRLIGGCSSVNGAYFVRGTREDFDRWQSLGNPAWSYENVLAVYRRLEDDADFTGEFHGKGGPVPVRRDQATREHPITNAFFEASFELGFPEQPDKNAPTAPGIGLIPRNVVDSWRYNAALSYLVPNTKRANLEVRGNQFVRRVLFQDTRAIGVEVEADGSTSAIHADEVVLSAGAVKSPHLLLLSGVGPAEEIRTQGLELVQHSPGVGKGFMDHAHVAVSYRPTQEFPNVAGSAITHACLDFTAADSPYFGDIEVIGRVGAKHELHAPGGATAGGGLPGELTLGIGLQQPESRGEIRLVSPDPHVQPEIAYHYLSADLDRSRMRHAVRVAAELLETPSFRAVVAERTDPVSEDLADDARLDRWILADLSTATHTSRSCHMGPESDETAVVDEQCRVRGVDGLRVVDTSVMPFITSRGPSCTAVMIGEHASDFFIS